MSDFEKDPEILGPLTTLEQAGVLFDRVVANWRMSDERQFESLSDMWIEKLIAVPYLVAQDAVGAMIDEQTHRPVIADLKEYVTARWPRKKLGRGKNTGE